MLRGAILLSAVASASCFAPAAHLPNGAVAQRRSVALLMKAPVEEEKKGFLGGMFGGKKEEVSGKVVPTGGQVRMSVRMGHDGSPWHLCASSPCADMRSDHAVSCPPPPLVTHSERRRRS